MKYETNFIQCVGCRYWIFITDPKILYFSPDSLAYIQAFIEGKLLAAIAAIKFTLKMSYFHCLSCPAEIPLCFDSSLIMQRATIYSLILKIHFLWNYYAFLPCFLILCFKKKGFKVIPFFWYKGGLFQRNKTPLFYLPSK